MWKHKLFPLSTHHYLYGLWKLLTPDYTTAMYSPISSMPKSNSIYILWVGNVEIHDKASDWYVHGHDKDERYDNVILHVCGAIDVEAKNSKASPSCSCSSTSPKTYRSIIRSC